MSFYTISEGTPAERDEIKHRFAGLEELSPEISEKVITAWVTVWKNSSFKYLDDIPYALQHRLMDHVVEVVRLGIALNKCACDMWGDEWKKELDRQELIQVLLLHDLDKPLLYVKKGDRVEKTPLASRLQHGVLGAMILKELGFSEQVVSTVATHALGSPFHSPSLLSYVLHYADLFSSDHALMLEGIEPFYQKHFR